MNHLVVVALVFVSLARGAAQDVLPAADSQCVLSTARDGQMLTIKGNVRQEPHDLAFNLPNCNETVLLTFAGYSDNALSKSELRQDEKLRRFQKYIGSTYKSSGRNLCLDCYIYGDIQAELTGELEIATLPSGTTKNKANFLIDSSGKIVGLFGWGHPMPFATYRFVVQAMMSVKARKLPPPHSGVA